MSSIRSDVECGLTSRGNEEDRNKGGIQLYRPGGKQQACRVLDLGQENRKLYTL